MHVLFLEVDAERNWALAAIGPSFLGSYLRSLGHEVSMQRVAHDAALADVVARVVAAKPDLLALSLTTRQWQRARRVVAAVRAAIDVPVVCGGLHPTFSAEEVLSNPGFDFVCLGEGEEAMRDLVDALAAGAPIAEDTIPNLQIRGGKRPKLRPPFADLDALPFMARDMLDEQHGVRFFATQRGCPFPCTYCAARKYDDLYEGVGDYGRRRSHTNVLAELDELNRGIGLSYVIFIDDTFTINRPWVLEFCRRYPEEIGKPFSIHARVETVTPEVLGVLAKAGCKMITYGVESGSYRVRREVMKRPVKNERFLEVFKWTQDVGITATANYMLGLPGETKAELDETLALAEQLGSTDFGYFVFYPYPGTSLFQLCKERGYLPEDYLDREANHRESILTLPDLTNADIGAAYDRFTALRSRLTASRQSLSLLDRARLIKANRESARLG